VIERTPEEGRGRPGEAAPYNGPPGGSECLEAWIRVLPFSVRPQNLYGDDARRRKSGLYGFEPLVSPSLGRSHEFTRCGVTEAREYPSRRPKAENTAFLGAPRDSGIVSGEVV